MPVDLLYVIKFVLLVIGWIVILPISILLLSEKIWVLGIYHTLESEKRIIKMQKVIIANAYLSIPAIVSFFIVIKNTVLNITNVDAFMMALLISLASIFSIRILANPSDFIKPAICSFFPKKNEPNLLLQHKERIISFFYSFICAAFIILFIIFSANIFMGVDVFISNDSLNPLNALFIILLYGLGLLSITYISEYILEQCPPIDQIVKQ